MVRSRSGHAALAIALCGLPTLLRLGELRLSCLHSSSVPLLTAEKPTEDDPFLGYAQLYAHTTYLDALLLGMIHRESVEQLIDASAIAFDAPDLSRHLQRLERRVSRFRSIYWLRDASRHGAANDLLNAYQAQHSLPRAFRRRPSRNRRPRPSRSSSRVPTHQRGPGGYSPSLAYPSAQHSKYSKPSTPAHPGT